MGLYRKYVLPRLIDRTCANAEVRRQREKVTPLAVGRVLEVGIGSGLNLPFYDPARVERVFGLDPAPEMLSLARRRSLDLPFAVEYLDGGGEDIPLERHSVDTVLTTFTLCTIADPAAALERMRRVLRPGGRLLFCEHGLAPDAAVRRWQGRLNPLWRRVGGGCTLDRDIPALIRAAGFRMETLETMYLPRTPRFAGFHYLGSARPD